MIAFMGILERTGTVMSEADEAGNHCHGVDRLMPWTS